ncbi:DUF922 domain-containing protein [Sphingomonas sp.]|uniref:DUF922 domain-containing protein n=1 Tax=Sphingomonas sp. TaxID=28214 RepID=UPI002E2ECF61|nr:DUF922 domain-containing protein [Sphingomonas sp.]HEX4695153.1 DUF922 domain-containing protein [Sphingomonas sp.]
MAAAVALAPLPPVSMIIAADESTTPFADIPNVTVISYDVAGRNPAAIRRSINAARPTDPNDGMRVDGLSHYEFRWRWRRDAQGACSVAPEDVLFSATVTVPRLIGDDASAKLREQFDRYRQSLLAHEDGHIRYAWNHRGDIAAAMNAATCATASEAAKAAVKAIADHDIAYDKVTRHGATTILPFG